MLKHQPRPFESGGLNSAANGGPVGAPLSRGLAQHGYTPDTNLAFENHGAEGHADRLPQLVAELVASKADVIVALGYLSALAAKQGTTLPVVVFSAGDPIGTGLVESLARPGGNLTGGSHAQAAEVAQAACTGPAPGGGAVECRRPRNVAALRRVSGASPGAGRQRPIGRARACRFRPSVRGNGPRPAGRYSHGLRSAGSASLSVFRDVRWRWVLKVLWTAA
ncbi:ABC transporter substrate binding protein [Rhizobiales bacterium GAS191]|nr:ABC transporter substrate binding protein [Rhizobiales bacterium GAS191]